MFIMSPGILLQARIGGTNQWGSRLSLSQPAAGVTSAALCAYFQGVRLSAVQACVNSVPARDPCKTKLVLVDSSFEPSTIGKHIARRIPLNDVMPSRWSSSDNNSGRLGFREYYEQLYHDNERLVAIYSENWNGQRTTDVITRFLWSFLGSRYACDESVELFQILFSQPIVVIGMLNCNELFWFIGRSEEPFPRRERNRSICCSVTLEQRAAVSRNFRYRV